jgi:hypothetical protein
MNLSDLPIDHYVPWTFLFAAALLASAVDAFARRAFHPVVMCVWFFGLTLSGAAGGWSVPEYTAGLICLVTPHMLICVVGARASRSKLLSDQVSPAHASESPENFPLPDHQSASDPHTTRRAA